MDSQTQGVAQMESLESKIHNFRQQIDACIQKTNYFLGPMEKNTEQDPYQYEIKTKAGREMALVRTKLQEAKMWAGKVLEELEELEELGSELPQQFQDKA